jgi:polysaccharide deacetylase 2 family uncharacterized protein YibQ
VTAMRIMIMTILLLFTTFIHPIGAETKIVSEKKELAIVIDDFGNDYERDRRNA